MYYFVQGISGAVGEMTDKAQLRPQVAQNTTEEIGMYIPTCMKEICSKGQNMTISKMGDRKCEFGKQDIELMNSDFGDLGRLHENDSKNISC